MWAKILEIIMRYWSEKPRKDLVRSLLELRDAMEECQESYKQHLRLSSESPEVRVRWHKSITALMLALANVDRVLSIFSPEARKHIQQYLSDEMTEARAGAVLGIVSMDLGTSLWLTDDVLDSQFRSAIDQLDHYIRAAFKPEEIAAVKSDRIPRFS